MEYFAEPEAFQYRETLNMTDEDFDFVAQTVQSVAGSADGPDGDED